MSDWTEIGDGVMSKGFLGLNRKGAKIEVAIQLSERLLEGRCFRDGIDPVNDDVVGFYYCGHLFRRPRLC